MSVTSRRRFLKCAAAVGAAMTLPTRTLLASSAAEQVNVGLVGCGGRGGGLLGSFSRAPGVKITGLCDVDQSRVARLAKTYPQASSYTDMRKMFDSPDIDAVVIATCNHWHCLAAIWAMQAGKHAYVEKPLGHTQWEGEQVIAAAAKHDRICQIGTQQRSDPMQAEIKQFLHEDKALGEIKSVRVNRFGARKSIGMRETPLVPPKEVDYNLWLGPAQDVPIYRNNLHYDWHWVWNTGSGEMGNWGVHIIDDVRNNLFLDQVAAPASVTAAGNRVAWNDAGETPNLHFASLDTGGIPVVVALSNLPANKDASPVPGPHSGYIAYCEGGEFHGQRGGAVALDAEGKKLKQFKGNSGSRHQQNFVDAIRAGDASLLNAPAQVGHDSTTWCNLINIASRVSTSESQSAQPGDWAAEVYESLLEIAETTSKPDEAAQLAIGPTLQFDAAAGKFVGAGADQANPLLRREDRKGFAVPTIA